MGALASERPGFGSSLLPTASLSLSFLFCKSASWTYRGDHQWDYMGWHRTRHTSCLAGSRSILVLCLTLNSSITFKFPKIKIHSLFQVIFQITILRTLYFMVLFFFSEVLYSFSFLVPIVSRVYITLCSQHGLIEHTGEWSCIQIISCKPFIRLRFYTYSSLFSFQKKQNRPISDFYDFLNQIHI